MTQEKLKTLMEYDSVTGEFISLVKRGKLKVGDKLGTINVQGYRQIQIGDTIYLAHRLAWLYVYGYMPEFIDHIDHNRANNSISNLRECTRTDNNRNCCLQRNNTSTVVGVSFIESSGKWRSFIGHNGKRIHLGNFDTFGEACKARELAEVKYGYHVNHGK